MLTVDEYAKIRRAHRDGMSIREIARQFKLSRQSVRKALGQPEPESYRRSEPYFCPKLTAPLKGVIDEILSSDEQVPRKQRHTATRIHDRLRTEHGYGGGYDQVRRYVSERLLSRRETFAPLIHEAGVRVDCDFGHIHVEFPGEQRLVAVLLATWCHSHYAYAVALPSEKTEAILEGTVQAFEFFGCVPRQLWWDNPTTVATEILVGRERRLQQRYLAMASHYNFEPMFCMPAKGQEKSHVENRVKRLQRAWATPVPRFADLEELNVHLRQCCLQEKGRTAQRQDRSIGERFEDDRVNALTLPARRFDACVIRSGLADKYQTVRHETNWYSVPRRYAFREVTIKAYVDRVAIVHRDEVVAVHRRTYGRDEHRLDPIHYLATLERKPALLDHSGAFRDWKLPESFGRLRKVLEKEYRPATATRHFIRILQLMPSYPLGRIAEAIDKCLARGVADAARIVECVLRQSGDSSREEESSRLEGLPEAVRDVTVSRPNLGNYDQLLVQEGEAGHG
jgi:transposase